MPIDQFQLFIDRAHLYDADMREWKKQGVEVKPKSNILGQGPYHMVMSYNPIDGESYSIRAAMLLGTFQKSFSVR